MCEEMNVWLWQTRERDHGHEGTHAGRGVGRPLRPGPGAGARGAR